MIDGEPPSGDERRSGTDKYPLLAVLTIVVASAPTTWLWPATYGYVVAAGMISLVAAYGLVFTGVDLRTDTTFLVLIGGYWLGLVAHYYVSPHQELLAYVVATPVVVVTTVVVLPQFVSARRSTFAAGLTVVTVLIVLVGIALLWLEHTTSLPLPQWFGQPVAGYGSFRTVSIYRNPNTYGVVTMVGTLTAVYTYLSRRGVVWLLAIVVCFGGFILAEADQSVVGFIVGLPIVLSGVDRRLAFGSVGVLVVGAYGWILTGHVEEVMQTSFLLRVDRWVVALEILSTQPLWGIGFGPNGIGAYRIHNSYLHIPLATGVIAGGLYALSLWYPLAAGLRARWTPWTGYVVGTGTALLVALWFETVTLGGVSVVAVMLGVFVGLLLELDTTAVGSSGASIDSRDVQNRH